MIHEIGVELGAQLASKGCPIQVFDGPDRRPTTTFGRERIVVESDPAGDTYSVPQGARHQASRLPQTVLTRVQGVRITIYAQNPNKGSIYWEHRRRADQVLDMVLCALRVVVVTRANLLVLKSGKYLDPADLQASDTPGGAIYELLCTIDRGVADRNWDGTTGPSVAVPGGMIKNTTTASGETEDGGTTTETACGG